MVMGVKNGGGKKTKKENETKVSFLTSFSPVFSPSQCSQCFYVILHGIREVYHFFTYWISFILLFGSLINYRDVNFIILYNIIVLCIFSIP